MSWILWTMLLSVGCIFVVFLMSCLMIAKEADEKIDQFGPTFSYKHDRLKKNAHAGIHIQFQTSVIASSSPASPTIEIKRLAKQN